MTKDTHPLFQALIDHLPSGVSLMDGDLQLLACNSEFKRLLNFPKELFEPDYPDLSKLAQFNARRGEYGEGDPDVLSQAVVERARQRLAHVFERTRPDGTVLEIRGRPLPDGGFVSIYTDMTERKKAENAVQQTVTYLQAVLKSLPFGVLVLDHDLRVIYWNDNVETHYALPKGFINVGRPMEQVLRSIAESGAYGPGRVDKLVARRLAVIGKFLPYSIELVRAGGGIIQVRGTPVMVDGRPMGFIILQEDITERSSYQATLERLATTDHLTGLQNRRAFLEMSEKELRRSRRTGQPLALLMIDADHFKAINDTYGHPVGDEVLRKIGSTCREVLRDEDVCGRIGGEEFAITLAQATLPVALKVAERLRQTMNAVELVVGDKTLRFTVSVGVAALAEGVASIEKMLSVADEGLYAAKNAGRNCVAATQQQPPVALATLTST